MPNPVGTCFFINDLTTAELAELLEVHKRNCSTVYPRQGAGQDMFMSLADAG